MTSTYILIQAVIAFGAVTMVALICLLDDARS